MTAENIWTWLDRFAPFASQEDFDNSGLIIGDPSAEVHRVLFALDATLPVVREAVQAGAQLIVTHHPLMFGGVKRIRFDEPEGAILAEIAGARLSLIAAHTNFDQASGGTGDSLAAVLGLSDVEPVPGSVYLRAGSLPSPQTAAALLAQVDRRLHACSRLYGDPSRVIRRVAVGSGAIGEEFAFAAQAGAEAFVVGEIKHHHLLAAEAMGLTVLEAGHYPTEQPGLEALYQRFTQDAETGHWPVDALLTAIRPCRCLTANVEAQGSTAPTGAS
ncbi:MAG: Nif3-like dinuclear metal center hexameric protein [Eubacteriales bacterium]|nr:Nif3-like dinuclear metal center hexameric protein [Eubacteriales bacterium]